MSRTRTLNRNPSPREQITLEFSENALLPALAGAHSRNFVRLEQQCGVRIATRGNLVAVEGEAKPRAQAAAALRALYARLQAGDEVGVADVDAEIRFASQEKENSLAPEFGVSSIKTAANRKVRARSRAQGAYLDLMRTHELVFGIGPAGTGKTYLAAAMGAHLLLERRVERLILSRPALEAGERLGFLPGDLKEKIDPYLRPLYDALFETIGEQCVKLMESGVIEVAPLAFMRGRTLARAFVILDEAQNCTSAQMKMFLTRLGEDARMVVTGDPSQSDLPGGPQGLEQAIRYLSGVEGVAVARFSEADVVRHALVTRVVAAYNAHEQNAPRNRFRKEE
jgi:phosphate starvation-inducible PhoH-like protein